MSRVAASFTLIALLLLSPLAFAAEGDQQPDTGDKGADAAGEAPIDEATKRGREAYLAGVRLSKDAQWAQALEAFEQAAAARDAPIVQFNIGYCLRALGRNVAAREALQRAIVDPTGLPAPQQAEARGYLAEIDGLLVHLEVSLAPKGAALLVDGRPLASGKDAGTWLAGVAPPGKAKAVDQGRFAMVLDPGLHVITASRPGHQDAVIRKTLRPGTKAKLDLRLDELPATVAVRSEPKGAIVKVDGREVGLAPIEFERRAGRYSLEVVADGYESYRARLDLSAGQRADMTAKLVVYEEPLYKKWWFWSGAAAVVAAGVVVTYVVTRPEPEPPPYDAGNSGWLVTPALFRF